MDATKMHAFIIASPSLGEGLSAAGELAAGLVCSGSAGNTPCRVCRDCRKALAGIHPDVMMVRREKTASGQLSEQIRVEQIRALVANAQIMPNEAQRKVYIIEEAERMNPDAQNALLKLLEEPPGNAAFILVARSAAKLLPTVRSRCAMKNINSEESGNEAAQADAKELLKLMTGSPAELMRWCMAKSSVSPTEADAVFTAARELLADILCSRSDISLSPEKCAELDELFSKCSRYLKQNVSVKHVMGLVAVSVI